MARVLGPADYGNFALAMAIVGLGSLSLSLGGPTLMARYVPAAPADERTAVARAIGARLARWRMLGAGSIALAAAVLIAISPETFPPLLTTLIVTALVLDVGATLAFQIALGLGRTTLWSLRYPFQNLVLIVAALCLAPAAGATGAVAGVTVASAAAFGLGVTRIFAPLRFAERGAEIPAGAMRFGGYSVMAGFVLHLYQRGGVVAVPILDGSKVETGFAGLAIGVSLAGSYAVSQAFAVQLPKLAEEFGQDPEGTEAVGRRLARDLQLLLIPLTVAAALALDPLLPAIVGEGFSEAEAAFGPALAMLPLAPLVVLASQLATLRLIPEKRLLAAAVGALVFLAVAVALVPAWGAAGATSALLAGTLASIVTSALVLPRAFSPQLVAAALTGAAMVLAAAELV